MAQKHLSVSRDASSVASLGQWISRRRHHLGLTQKALASRARCSVAWVKKIEQDRHPLGEELAAALAEALEIPRHLQTSFVRSVRTSNLADFPAPDTLESLPEPPTQAPLPSQPTRFFGRVRELHEISRALQDPACRLLTLLGPGGIGKTRLALHAGEQLKAAFDAVTFVSLRDVDSREGIAQAIADALGLPRLAQSDPTLQIAAYLREVQPKTLLILDNFEHLTDGADVVDVLLEHARDAKALVTSRERLRSLWEQTLLIDGLEYPSEASEDNPEEYSSVQLFIERARRAFPRFPRSETPDVARLCRLVEGHPLAIELAAAWVASFACSEIVAQVENNIELLKKQRQDLGDAHRSVAAAFDYSYALLAPAEQQVFRALGLFEGGFELDAAEHVAHAGRRTLAELVDKSLVQREGRRFNLHELLRLYASEKLAANAAEERARGAEMFRYYLDYARAYQQDYALLEVEWSNFNAGLRLAHQQGEWHTVTEYVTTLQQPWEKRGRYSDMRQAYRLALQAAQERRDEKAYADTLREWGRACIEQGDYAEAEEYLKQSLEIAERLEYQAGIANAQFDLARINWEQSDFERAKSLIDKTQRLREQLEDTVGIAAALYWKAIIENDLGNSNIAQKAGEEALQIYQAQSEKRGAIRVLRFLAHLALRKSELTEAEGYCSRALELAQELQDTGELASVLRSLAEVYRRKGNLPSAREYAEQSLDLFKQMGDRKSHAQTLYSLAVIHKDNGDLNSALKVGTSSLGLCRELKDRWGIVYVLDLLGLVQDGLGKKEMAHQFWSEAEQIAAEFPNSHPQLESIQARLRGT